MASDYVELLESVTPEKVEYAYGLAQKAQHMHWQSFADIGYRAALARDDKMLKVMEKAAEIVMKMSEEQTGRTRRDPSTPYAERVEHTESQLWREAYRLMDEGKPIRNFEWIYGAGAWLSGYVVR